MHVKIVALHWKGELSRAIHFSVVDADFLRHWRFFLWTLIWPFAFVLLCLKTRPLVNASYVLLQRAEQTCRFGCRPPASLTDRGVLQLLTTRFHLLPYAPEMVTVQFLWGPPRSWQPHYLMLNLLFVAFDLLLCVTTLCLMYPFSEPQITIYTLNNLLCPQLFAATRWRPELCRLWMSSVLHWSSLEQQK